MFDFVRRHTRILQFILLLLIVPSFVVFGIQGYDQFSEGRDSVARVDGQDISRSEWDNAHRNQIERMRAQMPGIDVKMLDTPEVRQRVLEQLVDERVIFAAARDLHLTPTEQRLERLFKTDAQFEQLRNPDGSVRKELLAAQGMTSAMFAQRLSQDIAMSQVTSAIALSAFAPETVARAAVDAFYQRREVRVVRFDAREQLGKVQVTDADLQAYYDDAANARRFQSPESVTMEYLVLDLPSVERGISIAEDDLRKYYSENASRYEQAQERRARHILIKAEAGSPADVKAAARSKAEALLAEVKKNPAGFAELAKKSSEDPGSAPNGGDLDWFPRGAMVKPFEDTVFVMKKGEISGIVETDFGFHIIELTDLRGGERRSFESVRAEIEAEVRKSLAQKRYAEAAEQFSNLVEQEDTLEPVAAQLKLTLRRVERFTRAYRPAAQAEGAAVLANPKLAELAFLPDNLAGKHNSQATDIGGNQMVAVRVLEHQPSRRQPLADVRDAVRAAVQQDKAARAARAEGEARLAKWKASAPPLAELPAAQTISRARSQDLPRPIVDAVLKASVDTLPAWIGVDLGQDGHAVVMIEKVQAADAADTGPIEQVRQQYAAMWAQAETEAYRAALRKRYKSEITAKARPAEEPAAAASK
ncbi:peptidyl-prolyl cis-trans isomerase D [Sphaerotilus sulfidivorans]|jgi:peptidyl-prolyl cis-trans isomerase D|uniref:Periplasmic chaperone PpiD n=3 Tax=Sphaerotilus sulfidivorans TaxID=639200 RepID=A0A5C1Q0D6_9BURK|nr:MULTISPECIES: SurA N-terminal domain-containing protein [Sphaerotilus]QEN00430.1 peptidyl-prolyl cis-trans isomerase [Sphaerotilus sulfidivorans]GKQ59380.1 peptidylprolyl isomerase [Sphaerotilus sp. FB-3]